VLFVNIHCVQCRIYSGCLPKALGQNKNRSFEEKICNQSDFFLLRFQEDDSGALIRKSKLYHGVMDFLFFEDLTLQGFKNYNSESGFFSLELV
jgi:hypothetical protein